MTQGFDSRLPTNSSGGLYAAILDLANDGIVVHTDRGQFLYVNNTLCRRLGYTRDELMKLNVRDIDPTEHSRYSPTLFDDLHEQGRMMFETIHRTKGGSTIPMEVNSVLIDFQGTQAVLSIARDITARLKSRENLQRSRATLKEAQRIAHIGNWDWRIEEGIHEWSDELYHIFGIDLQPVEHDTFYKYVHPDDLDRVRNAVNRSISNREPFDITFRIRLSDGSEKIVHEIGETSYDDNGSIKRFYGTTTDITESFLANQELQRSNHDLELYASLLHHDLRNDLHLIKTQVDASKLLDSENEGESKALEVIDATVQRMTRLLGMFTSPSQFQGTNLFIMLESALSEARGTTPSFKFTLSNRTENKSLQVNAGRLLPLVWRNLIRNAIDYGGSHPEVEIVVMKEDSRAVVDVLDNGPGVSSDIKEHLFEKGASTSGGGYGLYLCRRVLEVYHGSIVLMNDERHKGAIFRVSLPLA